MTIALYHASVTILVTANLLVLLIGAFHAFRPGSPRYLVFLYIYLAIALIVDCLWLYDRPASNPLIFPQADGPSLFHVYVIAELLAFTYLLFHVTRSGWAQKNALFLLAIFALACAATIFLHRFQYLYAIAMLTEIGVCIPLCITFFHELFQNYTPSKNLLEDPPFWLVTGISFYFATAIPLLIALFCFDRWGLNKFAPGLHAINNFALFITYLLFAKGYTCRTRKS